MERKAHHAPHTPEDERRVQEPQGMQALWIVRLQQLKHRLQSLDVQIPRAQPCTQQTIASLCTSIKRVDSCCV